MIEVQVLTPDDWELWRGLRLEALAEAPYAFGSKLSDWQDAGDHEERWRSRLSMPGSFNLLAHLGGEPVGMASGAPGEHDAATVELLSMWVGPKGRGRGLGDLLIDEIERWAIARGAETFELAVAVGNDAAIALYARNGFVDTGRREEMPHGGQEQIMSKPIRRP